MNPRRRALLVVVFASMIAVTATVVSLDASAALAGADAGSFAKGNSGASSCFTEYTGDTIADFASANADAVQQAVDAAAPGAVVKVAGDCFGVQSDGALTQTVYIDKDLTVAGGYTVTNWLSPPDPDSYPTTLSGIDNGRVLFVESGTVVVRYMTLAEGNGFNGGGGDSWAGAVRVGSSASLDLESVIITDSHSSRGGGIMNTGDLIVLNSEISDNSGEGGGLFNDASGVAFLENSLISGNSGSNGAGIQNRGFMAVTNSTISGNAGDGVNNFVDDAIVSLSYATVANNSGDGIRAIGPGDNFVDLMSSILAYNGGYDCRSNSFVVASGVNLIQDTGAQACGLDAEIGVSTGTDPLLLPLANNGGDSHTHALGVGSPAKDVIRKGEDLCGGGVVADQRGVKRPQLGFCDAGAFEEATSCPSGSRIYADKGATGLQQGESWSQAYNEMRTALFVTQDCGGITELWVATGIYTPGAHVADTFLLADDLSITGGFKGDETSSQQRDWLAHPTVLSGDMKGDDQAGPAGVVTTPTNLVGSNNNHVVTGMGVTGTAALDGFIITSGQASDSTGSGSHGGGMFLQGASPSLRNLRFSGNWALRAGGGLNNQDGGSPTLTGVTFWGNQADHGGGMANSSGSDPLLARVSFLNNLATNGGGMHNDGSSPRLTAVRFAGNWAGQSGGGIYGRNSDPVLRDVSFAGNEALKAGGAMYNHLSNPTVINGTFSGNLTHPFDGQGGGIYNSNSHPALFNSILWHQGDNSGTGTLAAAIFNGFSSGVTLTHSLIQGSGGSGTNWVGGEYVDGGGNLDQDPLFTGPFIQPQRTITAALSLRLASPAVDAGDNQYVTTAEDLAGNNRIEAGSSAGTATVDMGAFELKPSQIYLPLVVR